MSEREKHTGGFVVGPISFTSGDVPLPPRLAALLAGPPEFKGEFKGGRWDGLKITYWGGDKP